jgi:hypothetical protein
MRILVRPREAVPFRKMFAGASVAGQRHAEGVAEAEVARNTKTARIEDRQRCPITASPELSCVRYACSALTDAKAAPI